MLGLLIAVGDIYCRKQMAELFVEAGYNVIVPNSAANALCGILKNTAQVVLIGSGFDGLTAADMIPLLKRCNRKLSIILVADDPSPALIRKLRREGIFYHALKPVSGEDREEIRQAVQCAFQRLNATNWGEKYNSSKGYLTK